MKKVIFLDRDGTIIDEPKIDQQVDNFSKLSFIPGVFKYLEKINNELGYDLVMVTNQDGLGTDSFPQDTFWPIQNFIIDSFKNALAPCEITPSRSISPIRNPPSFARPDTG